MIVTVNENKNRVEVHLRGEFKAPTSFSNEMTTLYQLSSQYDTAVVYINSCGGRTDALVEILSVFGRFQNLITVACGQSMSSGLVLWASGKVRVVQPYTAMMAHRESYAYDGKTAEQLEFAKFTDRLHTKMVAEYLDDILTDEEKQKILVTEVFLTADDMLERGCAISWEQFCRRDDIELDTVTLTLIDGIEYQINQDGTCICLDDKVEYDLIELIYDVPYKSVLIPAGYDDGPDEIFVDNNETSQYNVTSQTLLG